MGFNLADLWEQAADAFAERECLVANGVRRSYAQLEERANRLAHHLAAHGVGPGDRVGIYAHNCVEWVETLWAVFKIRAVWININYRYVEDELRYLFDNAELRALVFAREYAPRVAAVRDCMPRLAHALVIDDGSGAELGGVDALDYEAALASGSPDRGFAPRSGDDHYILYTGGTTGMPKGVVWRHEDVFMALGGGIDQMSGAKAQRPEEMLERAKTQALQTYFATAPLMHGASQWCVMGRSFLGGKTVLAAKFDAADVWRLVAEEKVQALFITGDAMGRPLADALEARGTAGLESLVLVTSTAAVFSPTVKDDFFRFFPNLVIVDGVGASEVGGNGVLLCTKGNTRMLGGGPTFKPGPGTVVLGDDLRPVAPGSGVIGRIARTGHIPLEYWKDPKKSAETFFTAPDGQRYSMPGDFARVEADGQVTLLGRGSVSINSGGEKIYPEEVEHAIKSHAACFDAVVIGVPDERWGSRVAAIVEPRPGASVTLEELQAHCRDHLAGFKIPRQLTLVNRIERSPAGKPDYRWAQKVAGDAKA
ncbi:MAG: acyl-CoA synthetase [Proteobacteria bacterium]|nr:MAG: acyl-CoA synthetase [Pseudomonadota bacterium]